ncbi:hypothetical protein JXM67_09115 [candidate division WOR-3 bacterium]|nr:hypothetical protein [candidate division WOR-3 bacterium]
MNKNRFIITAGLLGILSLTTFLGAKKTVFLSSPRYKIDIACNVQGQCDPYEGAAFSMLSFSTDFEITKFGAPMAETYEVWFYTQSEDMSTAWMPGIQIHGEGTILGYSICPAWESEDEPIEAKVKKGPTPFKPWLELLSEKMIKDTASMETLHPIAPTAWFRFTTGFSVTGDELAWEYEKLGTASIENYYLVFSVPVADLAQGKAVMIDTTIDYGYETDKWSVIFTPLSEN